MRKWWNFKHNKIVTFFAIFFSSFLWKVISRIFLFAVFLCGFLEHCGNLFYSPQHIAADCRPVYMYGLISLPSLMKAILLGITKIYILITLQQYVLVFLRNITPIVDTIFLTFRNDIHTVELRKVQ